MIKIENLRPDSIEELFCKPFKDLKCNPLTKEDTSILMNLLFIPKGVDILEGEDLPLVEIIKSRLETFSYIIEDSRLLLYLGMISGTPGNAIMYLTYLQYYSFIDKRKNIDLEDFCRVFPVGFPSEEDLQSLWDSQKVKRPRAKLFGEYFSDNLLDYSEYMKSINFK